MDALTHVFLPLTVAYAVIPDLFPRPWYVVLGVLGLGPDLDKLIGMPGLLHSLLTVVPICIILIVADRWYRGNPMYGLLTTVFVLSHLVLDIIQGVTIPLLYPLVTTGIGLAYPMEIIFGTGPLGFTVQNPPVALEVGEIRTGYAEADDVETNTFGLIDEYGITSTITFAIVYIGRERWTLDSDRT